MQSSCHECKQAFEIGDDDLAIQKKMSPVIGGKTILIPPPTRCPSCRMQRRFAYRNDQHYYHNTCALCKKPVISIYSSEKTIPVLCESCFWGDQWDPLSYGREFDFSTPFFKQFLDMKENVPRLAIFHTQSENSDYTVHSSKNRNCYLCGSCTDCEDVYYSDMSHQTKSSMDLLSCLRMELCYQCSFSEDCYQCTYLDHCINCHDCELSYDCWGSSDLLGCTAQHQQKMRILNESATDEEIEETRTKLNTDAHFRTEFEKKYEALLFATPRRHAWIINSEASTGDDISQSKNVQYGFDAKLVEDAKYAWSCVRSKDLYDIGRVGACECIYESHALIDTKFSSFINLCYQSDQLLYCDNCQSTSECFGCMSLKKHKYCILNKQYEKEEYEELVPKILEQMKKTKEFGEFFPTERSPFGYNETKACELFPLTKKEVTSRGWKWSDYETPKQENLRVIEASALPERIEDIPDDVLQWAIVCEATKKPFRIIAKELEFYRQMGLPLPHRNPTQRHYDRVHAQNEPKLHTRACSECGKEMQTTYTPERKETILCESCYRKKML